VDRPDVNCRAFEKAWAREAAAEKEKRGSASLVRALHSIYCR